MRTIGLVLGVLGAFSSSNNIAVIESNDTVKAVQINPIGYSWRVFSGQPSTNAVISFNANYYWNGTSIGPIYDRLKALPFITGNPNRPYFVITPDKKADIIYKFDTKQFLLVQGGPTLLFEGKYSPERLKLENHYGNDTVRKTSHVALGIKKGKFIVAYFADANMLTISNKFKSWGCDKAMKLDGGHSCYLDFKNIKINTGRRIPNGISAL